MFSFFSIIKQVNRLKK